MEKSEKMGISMISAVSQALRYRKENPNSSNDSIMNHVARCAYEEKDKQAKVAMIAAASKAIDIADRNPGLTDREIISQVMKDIASILQTIESHN